MKRFILLLNHDDISLSAYLQHCLERGEQFVKASGNVFTFRKTIPSKDRIAVVTYVNEDPDLKMKLQMEDYTQLMKKRGWNILDVGKPEDIFDSKRHVFLRTDQPDIPNPLTDPRLAEKAEKHESRSLIRCFTMLFLMLGFGIFFLGHDPDIFLSSNHILFPCIVSAVFWLASLIFCILGAAAVLKKRQKTDDFKHFLDVDKAVLFCMLAIFGLLLALIIDLVRYPDNSRTIVSGDQRITVYQDDIPLTLEDLMISEKGIFRSSRLTKRSGLLMSSLYASDQSFSDPKGNEDLSLISYAVYQSSRKSCLDWTASRKGLQQLPLSEEMAAQWHCEKVHTDGHHRMAAYYPDLLLVFSTTAELSEIDPEIVMEKLIPNY